MAFRWHANDRLDFSGGSGPPVPPLDPHMNNLDSDQASYFVGPNLGPNCLQRLSADGKSFVSRKKKINKYGS